ncbi:MAG: SOS response-associated peptidase [Acidimicrobiales bacterium]
MCGRIAQSEPSRYAQRLDALFEPSTEWRPSWNVGPMAPIWGVREHDGSRRLLQFQWGLLPGWANDVKIAARCFNARAESAAVKPMFRAAFRKRRLLVPVDGFYEWQAVEGTRRKQPYFFQRADGDPVVLAGLWEFWSRGGDERRSATVITSAAGPDMPVHDRQPVVLEPREWDRWLDPDLGDVDELEAMLEPRAGVLVHHRVSPDVGSVKNDGPGLVEEVDLRA